MSVFSRRVGGRLDAWGQRLVAEMSDRLETTVAESVRAEMRELARMLRQQGDAADEMAETFGRTLARLSVAVENLHARLEALDGGGSAGGPSGGSSGGSAGSAGGSAGSAGGSGQKVDGQPAERR